MGTKPTIAFNEDQSSVCTVKKSTIMFVTIAPYGSTINDDTPRKSSFAHTADKSDMPPLTAIFFSDRSNPSQAITSTVANRIPQV